MEMSFLYTVNPESDEPVMLLDKHIGFDEAEGWGIMGDLFQRELLALEEMGKKRIQVWINSPGGDVKDGYNIYNAMLKTKTKVDTYNFGMAASMAAVIFQAGRRRIMADYAWLMYHNPFSPDGTATDTALATFTESLTKMVATRCGKSEEEIREIMKRTTYILAEEAHEMGLCDEIESSTDFNRKRPAPVTSTDATTVMAFWRESNKVVNSIFPQRQTTHDMKKVANKLNLNAEASEDAIVKEIESIQNKMTDLNTKVTNLQGQVQAKEDELAKAKAELEAAKAKVQELEEKAKAEEEARAKAEQEQKEKEEQETAAKAKAMIEGFVTQGRIKNDPAIVNSWIEKAKADFDGVKNLIESLPLNKSGVKIETTTNNNTDSKKLTSVARVTMFNKLAELEGKK